MESSGALQGEAKRLMGEHRWKEALPILRDAIVEAPKDPWNVMYLGSCFCELREYANALRCFQHAGRLDPTNPTAVGLQADATHGLGDAEGARILYKRALELSPDDELAIKNWKRFVEMEGE